MKLCLFIELFKIKRNTCCQYENVFLITWKCKKVAKIKSQILALFHFSLFNHIHLLILLYLLLLFFQLMYFKNVQEFVYQKLRKVGLFFLLIIN